MGTSRDSPRRKGDGSDGASDPIIDPIHEHAESLRKLEASSARLTEELVQEILDRLDALEHENEMEKEIGALSRELRAYVNDKRKELRTLKNYRWFASAVSSVAVFFILGHLHFELSDGFKLFHRAGTTNEYALAAYVGGSLFFALAIILVFVRGVFGAIDQSDKDGYIPPNIKEIHEALKRLKGD